MLRRFRTEARFHLIQRAGPAVKGKVDGQECTATGAQPPQHERAGKQPAAALSVQLTKSVIQRYGLAVALVFLALCLTLILQQFVAGRPTLFLFFAVIVASAWFGGAGPGCLAVLLSVPAGLYFYFSELHLVSLTLDSVLLLFFCVVCALAGGVLSSRQRTADRILQETHAALETKADELQQANQALLAQIGESHATERALQETQKELARVSRLSSLGELAASIAHELNQPLAAVVTSASTCLRWLDADSPNLEMARRSASRLVRDGNRASEVLTKVRAMVRRALPDKQPLDVNATLHEVLPLVQNELDRNGVYLELRLTANMPAVMGDRIQLQQVFLNLITNAIEAMTAVDERARRLTISSSMGACRLLIVVQDTGEGLRADAPGDLFEAFVTTKPYGMGLGLSICRTIVEAHGGKLRAASAAPYGALFEIELPVGTIGS